MDLSVLAILLLVSCRVTDTSTGHRSKWVYIDADGKLKYTPLPRGDRIMDFSLVGFNSSNPEKLPKITHDVEPVVCSPLLRDHTPCIQAAIDKVAGKAVQGDGFKGVVQLMAGRYGIALVHLLHDVPCCCGFLSGMELQQS